MKRMILCAVMLLSLVMAAEAQTKKKTIKTVKKSTVSKSVAASKKTTASKNTTVSLSSDKTYAAKANLNLATAPSSGQASNFTIADPVISALNAKARGENTTPSLQIVGLSKHAYGFANGHLRLTPAGSTSSGGTTGLGGVATGNGLGAIGANPSMPGVNGKSPDAGSAMWGNARNLVIRRDSTGRN